MIDDHPSHEIRPTAGYGPLPPAYRTMSAILRVTRCFTIHLQIEPHLEASKDGKHRGIEVNLSLKEPARLYGRLAYKSRYTIIRIKPRKSFRLYAESLMPFSFNSF